MAIQTTAGATFKLSAGVPATFDAAGFAALTYTLIGEVTDMGGVGKTYNIVNHNPISNRRTRKLKGSYDPGDITLQYARDFADAGQDLLYAASNSDSPYAVEITLQDGSKMYFTALVASYKTTMGSVDQIVAGEALLTLQTDVIEV